MGLIRLLLAVAVIIYHSSSLFFFSPIDGQIVVHCFFIISGFYVALVLSEKYHNKFKEFIKNRFFKIYPSYWLVLIISFFLAGLFFSLLKENNIQYGYLYKYLKEINPGELFFVILSNILIFGLIFLNFTSLNKNGGLFLSKDPWKENVPSATELSINPPTWFLALELWFYLFSIFFIKLKTKFLIIIIFLLLILRQVTIYFLIDKLGFAYDPFIYRNFILQLVFFILGIVSYRAYNFIKKREMYNGVFIFLYITFILFLLFFKRLESLLDNKSSLEILFYFYLFILLPLASKLMKNFKIDRFLGDLSYPIYLIHFPLLIVFGKDSSLILIIFSIVSGVIIYWFFQRKIEKFKSKKFLPSENY